MTAGADEQLLARLQDVEARVRLAVEHRRADDPAPDDPFRGLYVNDESVERLLAGARAVPRLRRRPAGRRRSGTADDPGPQRVAHGLRAAAPGHGPGARPGQPVRAALRLPQRRRDPTSGEHRAGPGAGGRVDDVRRGRAGRCRRPAPWSTSGWCWSRIRTGPFLTRSLRVPDRVIAHLLGDPSAEPSTQLVLVDVEGYPSPLADRLAHALGGGAGVVHVREREGGTAAATAVAALGETGRDAVVVDLTAAGPRSGPAGAGAGLRSRGAAARRGPGGRAGRGPGRAARWSRCSDSAGGRRRCCSSGPRRGTRAGRRRHRWPSRRRCWAHGNGSRCCTAISSGSARTSTRTPSARTSPSARRRCNERCSAAQIAARLDGGRVTADDLRAGIRAQNAAGLERLARRIEPEVGWDDLVAGAAGTARARGAHGARPAPRPGARRLADAQGRRPRPRRDRPVRRRLRHRQDHVRRGDRGRSRP